ncbi:MAG: outer membrane protein assembly factor BamA [Runella slithyformis]|nr:MAG: outer membrane protein assembly factor BamA [Runella slithyformis]TAE99776.1 MAG: outer membrane protein assembly factor BamA [Runella slithyformis]TAF28437.1 MAG: outer membrane protein assembly factor BamA [Runella slithyformis]TAF47031.1 MAG: outer membrane protein assembly factor BamA [Runella slithyformis]TAF81991.1 MAG: outer membrane protein assembly factor BamA [Runella slithyformis]
MKHQLHYPIVFSLLFLVGLPASAQRLGLGRVPAATAPAATADPINYAEPKEYVLADVIVTGNQFLDPNSMISMSGLRVGDKIKVPGETITGAIKKLMDQKILDDVEVLVRKIEGEQIFLELHIKEQPRLFRVTYQGIRKGEQESLNDKVKLPKGRIISNTMVKNAQLAVKRYFIDKGFLNTKVRIVQIPDTTRGNAVMKIFIDKGTKVKISNIVFNGRNEILEGKIRMKLKNTKQMRFGRLFTPSKFIPKKYEEDKQKLIEYYNKMGFRDAVVASDSIINKEDKTVEVVMNIEEGARYYIRNVTWDGNYIYTNEQLSKILALKKGDVYNPEDLDKRLNGNPGNDVSSVYMDDGYLYYRCSPVEKSIEGDSIDIEMRIFEGKQATINKIILNGNTKTSDHVVMRELFTLPGQKFSKTEIINTQRTLSQLGYFDPEKIGINPVPHPENGTVDIEYTVEEKPSDQIELSGGWGGFIGFVGTLGLVFNNFSARNITNLKSWRPLPSGDGQKVAIRFQASGRQFQTYSASFTEPWLGGKKPVTFGVSITKTVFRQFDFNDPFARATGNVSFRGAYHNTGVTVSIGKRLRIPDRFFTLSTAISYQRYRLDSLNLFGIAGFDNGVSNNLTFNATIARNTIDNPQFPRSGSSFSLSGTFTPPYSSITGNTNFSSVEAQFKWVEYHKWMFDASWFATVTGKLVLSTRAHMGFLGRYNPNLSISPFERFVLGGAGLAGVGMFALAQDIIALRGYADRQLVPIQGNDLSASSQNVTTVGQQSTRAGGVAYSKYVMELRYPLSLNPSATIFGLVFAEAGNNWGTDVKGFKYKDFNPFDLKRSAGVGAKIFMPAFGLIGIDWAYGFDPLPGQTQRSGPQFHFTIGQQIR